MTVISAIIKKNFIVIASDSLIRRKNLNAEGVRTFSKYPKFVAFPQLKCVVSYWGNVRIVEKGKKLPSWDIREWLIGKLEDQGQFTSVETFGELLTKELTIIFKKYSWHEPKMLGIHLIGFEYFENKWIPELFLIIGDSNGWNFNFSRRTYGDSKNWEDLSNTLIVQREEYYSFLENGYSIYNNGDNEMFNHFFNSFHGAIKSAYDRKQLIGINFSGLLSKEFFVDLATLPIKQIAKFQKKYYNKDHICVGGKIHVIVMYSDGKIDRNLSSN